MKEEQTKKKGSGGRLIKVMLGILCIGGGIFTFYSNGQAVNEGYEITTFGTIAPYALIALGFAICLWAIGGKKKKKADDKTITPIPEAVAEAVSEPIELEPFGLPTGLKVVRRCDEPCPVRFTVATGEKGRSRAFCASNGERPEKCLLSQEDYEKLFSDEILRTRHAEPV